MSTTPPGRSPGPGPHSYAQALKSPSSAAQSTISPIVVGGGIGGVGAGAAVLQSYPAKTPHEISQKRYSASVSLESWEVCAMRSIAGDESIPRVRLRLLKSLAGLPIEDEDTPPAPHHNHHQQHYPQKQQQGQHYYQQQQQQQHYFHNSGSSSSSGGSGSGGGGYTVVGSASGAGRRRSGGGRRRSSAGGAGGGGRGGRGRIE